MVWLEHNPNWQSLPLSSPPQRFVGTYRKVEAGPGKLPGVIPEVVSHIQGKK
jgi:hypothetical protein